jgi:predicted SprT family Zn-dependent metalloprotease
MASSECMSIFDFITKISDTAACLNFLRENHVIATSMTCKKCSNLMKLSKKPLKVCSDGEQWTCGKCKTSLSIRDRSFFKVIKCVIV